MKYRDDIYIYEWANYFDNNCNSYYIGGNVQALIDPGLTLSSGFAESDGKRRHQEKEHQVCHQHAFSPDHFQGSELFDQEKVNIALHRKEMEFPQRDWR